MRVYKHGAKEQNLRMFVEPGRHHPDVSEWMVDVLDSTTGQMKPQPKQIEVRFENGCAVVPDNLGKYMVDRQLAQRTQFIQGADGAIETPPQFNQLQDRAPRTERTFT